MTMPQSSDRTPDRWEEEARADQQAEVSAVRVQRNPWMILLTVLWVLLLIGALSAQASVHTVDPETLDTVTTDVTPVVLVLFLSAGFVAVAQVVALAIRWSPKDN